jgi:hypothetical protein
MSIGGDMADNVKMLAFVAQCDDPAKLKALIANARRLKAEEVADAAFRKLIALVPEYDAGSVEHDLWRTINAFEHFLTEERDRTTRLSRTRQKLTRTSVVETLADWALKKQATDGFRMLMERNMPELMGEAFILRHRDKFAPEVIEAANQRLTSAGVDVGKLPSSV